VPASCAACGSACCTGGCRHGTRSRSWPASAPARSTCWWPRPSSRSASTCRTPR
jgi:hypothetical protein